MMMSTMNTGAGWDAARCAPAREQPSPLRTPALVLLVVPATLGRSPEHEAIAVALHGRGVETRDVTTALPAGQASSAIEVLTHEIEGLVEQAGRRGARVGLWAEGDEVRLALAGVARARCSIEAFALSGGGPNGELERVGTSPPCLFLLGPGELDQERFYRQACAVNAPQRQLVVLPQGDDERLGLRELCWRKAELAAQWFVDHLVVPMPAALPFDAAGPARQAAQPLSQRLAPRHSEFSGPAITP